MPNPVPPNQKGATDREMPLLFPPECSCSSYGHDLTMTRVDSPDCAIHHPRIEALVEGERVMIETPVDP